MWPTPTPLPTSAVVPSFPVDPATFTGSIADGIIQGWHMFDVSPVSSLIWFIVVGLIIFVGLMSIRRHLESL